MGTEPGISALALLGSETRFSIINLDRLYNVILQQYVQFPIQEHLEKFSIAIYIAPY